MKSFPTKVTRKGRRDTVSEEIMSFYFLGRPFSGTSSNIGVEKEGRVP